MNDNVIPVRIPSSDPLAEEYKIKWTPALITADWDAEEHHRTVGFLPPEELIPTILLGVAKLYFDKEVFDKALSSITKLLKEYPASDACPEAIFMRGVCGYKSTHNPQPLKESYEQLAKDYPGSAWTKRAYPYRLL